MKIIKTYIISLFLLGIFLYPSVIKITHKHKPTFHCSAKNEKHFHEHHEKCIICAFYFSHFIQQKKLCNSFIKEVFQELIFTYKSILVQKPYYVALLLRGPPLTNGLIISLSHCLIVKKRNINEQNINNVRLGNLLPYNKCPNHNSG